MDTKKLLTLLTVTFLIVLLVMVYYNDKMYKSANEAYDMAEECIKQLNDEIACNEQLYNKLVITKAQLSGADERIDELEQELSKFTNAPEHSVAAAPTYEIPLSTELQQYTYDTCRYYGIEDYYILVLAMMWQESDYNPNLISSTDDYGLMQINVCNHDTLRELLGIVDFLDPEDSIEAGVYTISVLLHKYEEPNKALMAYNMGPGGAAAQWRRGNYTSTYSTEILAKAELIKSNSYQ